MRSRGCPRFIVKFFRERTPCSCLDQIYSKIKSQPKTGLCQSCGKRERGTKLRICSACGTHQYCSSVCKRADWPNHEATCEKTWVRWRSRDQAAWRCSLATCWICCCTDLNLHIARYSHHQATHSGNPLRNDKHTENEVRYFLVWTSYP